MSIAKAIKRYRLSQGLTQLDLAIKINKTVRSIQRYEKGDITPSIKILSEMFNMSIDEIILKGLKGKGII